MSRRAFREKERENDHHTREEIPQEGIQGEKELERENGRGENVQEGESGCADTRRVSDQEEENVQENDQKEKSKDNPAPKGKQKTGSVRELLVDDLSSYYQPLAKRRVNKKTQPVSVLPTRRTTQAVWHWL